MSMPLTADDVVVGILHELRKTQPEIRLTADRERLHMAFADLRSRFEWVADLFTFRQRETFPESAELDQAFSNLDATGLISRYNQTPRYYVLAEGLDVCYETFSGQLLVQAGVTTNQLADAANAIRDAIGERPA